MAKGAYIGVDGVARKVKKGYVGVENFTKRSLPSGYTQVAYIESSGTQYVDTGFKPSYNSRVVVDVSDISASASMVFGCRNEASATASQQFNIYRKSASEMRSDYFGTNATLSISDTTQRTTIDKNGNVVTMYGTTLTNTAVSSGTVAYNLYLFACNSAGRLTAYGSFRLYSCQIYDNGTLVRDYVPCTNSSGTAGLYDMVGGAFYANAGSGTFTVGSSASSVARKIKNAYIGDENGIARLFWSSSVADIAITYSGNMTDEIVTMSGVEYRLLTLTSSGTLTIAEDVAAEVWMCGGGTTGKPRGTGTNNTSGGGGGAGAFTKSGSVTLSGSMTAVVGAGGSGTAVNDANLGSATSFAGLETSTDFSNYTSSSLVGKGVNGGTGGGGCSGSGGTGDGVSKYPFGDTSYFKPHCAGGGGGGYAYRTDKCIGGAGGTNGGSGSSYTRGTSGTGTTNGGIGGNYGGGAGGNATYNGYGSYACTSGSAATFYGSGGGGAALSFYNKSNYEGSYAGAGYQGVIYIRIPLAA